MKQIKWFRNLFLIGATSFMLLSVAACNNKPKAEEKKKPAATEFKVEFSAKAPDGATISADDLKKLVVAKKGTETITSGTKVAKDTEITFEFATAEAKGVALKEWKATGATIADAEKTKLSVKVKITADTTISAELEKALTPKAILIYKEAVDLATMKVTIPFSKTQVAKADVADGTNIEFYYFDSTKALKSKNIAFEIAEGTFPLTGISGTEAKVLKLKSNVAEAGHKAWAGNITVIAEKENVTAKVISLKIANKAWKEGDGALVVGKDTIAITDVTDVVIKYTAGSKKDKVAVKAKIEGTKEDFILADLTTSGVVDGTGLNGTAKAVKFDFTATNVTITQLSVQLKKE